jgi:hypothetical protein
MCVDSSVTGRAAVNSPPPRGGCPLVAPDEKPGRPPGGGASALNPRRDPRGRAPRARVPPPSQTTGSPPGSSWLGASCTRGAAGSARGEGTRRPDAHHATPDASGPDALCRRPPQMASRPGLSPPRRPPTRRGPILQGAPPGHPGGWLARLGAVSRAIPTATSSTGSPPSPWPRRGETFPGASGGAWGVGARVGGHVMRVGARQGESVGGRGDRVRSRHAHSPVAATFIGPAGAAVSVSGGEQ